jgi:hypothetical protein
MVPHRHENVPELEDVGYGHPDEGTGGHEQDPHEDEYR